MWLKVLYLDDDLVAVEKPAGISTHAAQPDVYPSDLIACLGQQLGSSYFGVHQRLDKETSGIVLLARRPEANAGLAASFEEQRVRKRYLALVHGVPRRSEGMIDAPLAPGEGGKRVIASASDPRAQQARTHYRLLASSPDRRYALLELLPETGRTHQLRVHLAHLGHPIVGDTFYNPDQPAPRLMLHAQRLELPHPAGHGQLTIEATPPPIFASVESGLPALRLATQLLEAGEEAPQLLDRPAQGLGELLQLAAARREPLEADPSTTAYRLINAAGDGIPGLTIDRFGDVLVLNFYDESIRSVPPMLLETLAATFQPRSIYVKYRPRQASRLSEEERELVAPSLPAWGEPIQELAIVEDGLRYLIRPGAGLSVGLFLDMRETRGRVRRWAAGKRVLNCFAYTCGFGLAASAGGAADVLNLDVSKQVLDWGREQYVLNGMEPPMRGFLAGDVFDLLDRFGRKGNRFDLVILDPPSFATTKRTRFSVARDYGRLAALAANVVAPGGILLACSNLAGTPRRTFRRQVVEALAAVGRSAEVIGYYAAPALDFPTFAAEESYLKVLALKLP